MNRNKIHGSWSRDIVSPGLFDLELESAEESIEDRQ